MCKFEYNLQSLISQSRWLNPDKKELRNLLVDQLKGGKTKTQDTHSGGRSHLLGSVMEQWSAQKKTHYCESID